MMNSNKTSLAAWQRRCDELESQNALWKDSCNTMRKQINEMERTIIDLKVKIRTLSDEPTFKGHEHEVAK